MANACAFASASPCLIPPAHFVKAVSKLRGLGLRQATPLQGRHHPQLGTPEDTGHRRAQLMGKVIHQEGLLSTSSARTRPAPSRCEWTAFTRCAGSKGFTQSSSAPSDLPIRTSASAALAEMTTKGQSGLRVRAAARNSKPSTCGMRMSPTTRSGIARSNSAGPRDHRPPRRRENPRPRGSPSGCCGPAGRPQPVKWNGLASCNVVRRPAAPTSGRAAGR